MAGPGTRLQVGLSKAKNPTKPAFLSGRSQSQSVRPLQLPVFQIILIKFIVFKKTACHTTPSVVYILAMIRSWANSRSRRFYEQGKTSKFGGMDTDAAEDLLAILDAAESLKDISPLKSVGLHKLFGDRAGQWAMTINGPWRICFRFKDGDAFDVEITDYHRG